MIALPRYAPNHEPFSFRFRVREPEARTAGVTHANEPSDTVHLSHQPDYYFDGAGTAPTHFISGQEPSPMQIRTSLQNNGTAAGDAPASQPRQPGRAYEITA